MNKKSKRYNVLRKVTWILCLVTFAFIFYVNWYMPHGPMINSGTEICWDPRGGEGGQCKDEYVEDTRSLNIPLWAKFLRENTDNFLWGFIVLIVFFEYKYKLKDKSNITSD